MADACSAAGGGIQNPNRYNVEARHTTVSYILNEGVLFCFFLFLVVDPSYLPGNKYKPSQVPKLLICLRIVCVSCSEYEGLLNGVNINVSLTTFNESSE